MSDHPIDNRTLYRRLVREVLPYWKHLTAIFLLSLLAPPIALLAPLPLKIAVDSVIGTHPLPRFLDACLPAALKTSPESLLLVAVALLVGVALVNQVRDVGTSWLSAYTGEKLLRSFRAKLFRHVQRLSLSYHDTRGTADSVYRIQYDATCLQRIAVEGVIPFVSSSLTLVAMVYVSVRISLELTLIALAVTPVIFLVSRTYRRRLRGRSREVRSIESSALAVVQEALGALRVVKAYGREDNEERRFARKSNEGMRARLKLELAEGRYELLVAVLSALGTAAVLFTGVHGVRSGAVTLGDLLLIMGYVTQLNAPLKTIGKRAATMQQQLAGAERAFALLDEPPDVVERPGARRLARVRGAMEFRDVSFAYEERRPVLSEVSFAIAPGTCLGVSGATGAGKTTLVNLLTRFYDPTAGAILLDGVDLRDCRLADLRDQFAFVLQEPVLFSTSIAENIAYARPDARQADIVAAAKAADAHEFITRLPQGYDTLVGERGMRLSGGERQRISLARAFLKDAPILVLDEPTSSVDVRTEASIVEAMGRLAKGRTTFLITHRQSALTHCDLILRIDHGRVLELVPGPSRSGPSRGPDDEALASLHGEACV